MDDVKEEKKKTQKNKKKRKRNLMLTSIVRPFSAMSLLLTKLVVSTGSSATNATTGFIWTVLDS